jgi:hypothetical protein
MHTTRDRPLHDRRRRVWAPAFSDKALREYEPKIKYFNNKLVERIRQFGGGPVNVSKWVCLYVERTKPRSSETRLTLMCGGVQVRFRCDG